jgi:hypothetical protein
MSKNSKQINENIFDLSKIGGIANDIQVEPVSSISYDQNALLQGYNMVSIEKWANITSGSHIRYLRKDGEFRKGGYITSIINTQDNEGINTIKFDLVSNYSPTAIKWSLYRGSIDKIWVKESAPVLPPQPRDNTELLELKMDIKLCKDAIESIKKELQKINNEQMHTVSIIRKLHNIK